MKFAGSQAMREMDRYTIDVVGVPSDTLMLRAARGMADEMETWLRPDGVAVILCGSGNNGGDGIAAAKFLLEDGYQAQCFMIGTREKMTEDAKKMEALLKEQGGVLRDGSELTTLEHADVIVDALFGTGLSRAITGKYQTLIDEINASGKPVIACDIVSGISADAGEILGCAVKADVTVTFNLPKTGQLLPPGTEYTGRLVVHDIGIPQAAKEQVSFDGTGVQDPV